MVQLTFKSRRLIAAAAEVARCNPLDEALFKSRKNIPRGALICYCTNTQKSCPKAQITYAFICKEATKRTNSLPYFWAG